MNSSNIIRKEQENILIINVKNFGLIKDAVIDSSKLNIVYGENNTNKTYLMYAILFVYMNIQKQVKIKLLPKHLEEIKQRKKLDIKISEYRDQITTKLNNKNLNNKVSSLDTFFNATEGYFQNTEIYVNSIENKKPIDVYSGVMFSYFGITIQHKYTPTTDMLHISYELNVTNMEKYFGDQIAKKLINPNENNAESFNEEIDEDITSKIVSLIEWMILSNIFDYGIPFVITSDRNGISLFSKEIAKNRIEITENLKRNKDFDYKSIRNNLEMMTSNFSEPVKMNIEYLNKLENQFKNRSYLNYNGSDSGIKFIEDWNAFLQGSFSVDEYGLYFSIKNKKINIKLPIHLASSSTKSLLLFDSFIKHVAQKGNVLFIDEPELNLNPKKQIIIARFLVRLINFGFTIYLTTHSDFIIRELNHLIILKNHKSKEQLLEKYNLDKFEQLDFNDLVVYEATKSGKIKKVNVSKNGMESSLFDETILYQMTFRDDLLFND